jgi:hypothetical protein
MAIVNKLGTFVGMEPNWASKRIVGGHGYKSRRMYIVVWLGPWTWYLWTKYGIKNLIIGAFHLGSMGAMI